MQRIVAILQARMGSSRLPGKALMDLAGKPVLWRCLERAQAISGVDALVVATTESPDDQQLLDVAQEAGVEGFTGSPDDVLDRYYQAAKSHQADVVMRLTGDCPLLDPSVSGRVLNRFLEGNVDYASNTNPPSYPDGLDTEVFNFKSLEIAWQESKLDSDREHVTQFIRRQPCRFHAANVAGEVDLSHLRWTVDEAEDLEFVRQVYQGLDRRGWLGHDHREVMQVIEEDGLQDTSTKFQRDEGLIRSLEQDKITRATP